MHLEKRILITGGAGFLGSHLCKRLLERGADVVCVDNFFTGAKRNIEHLLGHRHFELMLDDVTFPLYVEVDETAASSRISSSRRCSGVTSRSMARAARPA